LGGSISNARHSGSGDIVAGDKTVNNNSISIGGSNSGVINTGDNNTITNTVTTTNNDLKELLELFQTEAKRVFEALPAEKKDEFIQDVEIVTNDIQKGKKSKFFDISKEGLLEAADTVKEIGLKFKDFFPQLLTFVA